MPKHKQHSVTLDEARVALDILARNNIRYIHLTGGEPLMHRDLDAIAAHARRLGMSTLVVTNGWALSDERLEPEQFGCLAGYKFLFLHWHVDLYRCHSRDRPMCPSPNSTRPHECATGVPHA
jgi:pyruvate-formate lyase-activating enzyme